MRLDDVLGVFMAISQQAIFDAQISLTVNRQIGESTCKASLPLFGPNTGAHFTTPYLGGPSKRTRLIRGYLGIIKRKFLLSTRRGGGGADLLVRVIDAAASAIDARAGS